jgi:hypothetical protein
VTGGRRARACGGVALAVLLLAGCATGSGGDGRSDGASGASTLGPGGAGALGPLLGQSGPSPSPGGSTASGPTSTPPASPSTTSIAGLPAVTAVRSEEVGKLIKFQTPSKNIGCIADGTFLRCDIVNRSWNPPEKPADCTLDYGQGVEIRDGRTQFVCAGDTALDPTAPVLPYNQAVRSGDIVCVSTNTHLACRDTVTGHGFSLSKDAFPPMY